MKTLRLIITIAAIAIIGSSCSLSTSQNAVATGDPLSQWNEGPAKSSVLSLVNAVTDRNDSHYLPEKERVAVFDMDGTILLEKPNFVLFDFIIRMMMGQIAAKPELKQQQPFKAIYEQDWAYFDTRGLYGDDGLYSLLLYATEGYTEARYRDEVQKYLSTVRDKRYGKSYNQLVFAPMVQLIKYLQDHQFEVYIVSGSDPQFTRVFSEEAAGIPVQNVIGTTVLTKWVETDTGSYFIRVHKFVEPIDDEGGKPVNILNKTGRIPVLAVGNSTGDYQMLEYSKNVPFSLQMIVNHDDSLREYNYEADKMKMLCKDKGWQEISMKNDFRVIFAE